LKTTLFDLEHARNTNNPETRKRLTGRSVAVIPLGCAKAQVDAEQMLGALASAGYRIVHNPKKAEAVVINTCGFIQAAKDESLRTIFESLKLKETHGVQTVAITGCLAERYAKELAEDIPEADIVLPWSQENELVHRLDASLDIHRAEEPWCGERILLSPAHWAYLRISEGCNHRCAFCSIPAIRGKHISVPLEDLVAETERLAARGVREVNVVAQDTTLWGVDLDGKPSLPLLLRSISRVPGIRWVRLLYTHPAHVTDELVRTFAESEVVVPYLDMPIQHINDVILKRMNRIVGRTQIERIISQFRANIPQMVLRTTVIVGLPYETEKRFRELLDFVEETKFDRLGCFVFSPEEGTEAARMRNRVPQSVAAERQAIIMEAQRAISRKRNKARVGKEYEILTERRTGSSAIARSYAEAPEVDGVIRVRGAHLPAPGEWSRVRITKAFDYDLLAAPAGNRPEHAGEPVSVERIPVSHGLARSCR